MSVNGPIAFWGTGRSSVTYYLQSLDKENPMISISIIRLRPNDQTKNWSFAVQIYIWRLPQI